MKEHCDIDLDYTNKDINGKETIDVEETKETHNESTTDSRKQVCHTMTMKECETTYRPQMTKVKVRVCPNGINLDKESKQQMENR